MCNSYRQITHEYNSRNSGVLFKEMIKTYHENDDKSDQEHDLMYSHQMGIKVGYNKRFDKFYILIVDYETKQQTKAYIDEPDYEEIGHSILQNIKDIRELKQKEIS